jgi:hypothetical protein
MVEEQVDTLENNTINYYTSSPLAICHFVYYFDIDVACFCDYLELFRRGGIFCFSFHYVYFAN